MSGLQIHGRIQVDIIDVDQICFFQRLSNAILINLKHTKSLEKEQEIEDFY